jgi:hypothetical protein
MFYPPAGGVENVLDVESGENKTQKVFKVFKVYKVCKVGICVHTLRIK